MVSQSLGADSASREIAEHYTVPQDRPAWRALFALDDQLAGILQSTTEPIVGQMRLTWWHDAVSALREGHGPAHPVLQAIVDHVIPRGVTATDLAVIVEGWETLLEEPLDDAAITRFGELRGAGLFRMVGRIVGGVADPLGDAGRGWALADLALHLRDTDLATRARTQAAVALDAASHARWSRPARGLGALSLFAHFALEDATATAPQPLRRIARLARLRLIGR